MVKKRKKKVSDEVTPTLPVLPEDFYENVVKGEITVGLASQTVEETKKSPPKPKKPKVKIVYKTDARYELLKDGVARLLKRRPELGDVQKNPLLYHEWALEMERLLE